MPAFLPMMAMNELGKISLASNDRAAAKQYFQSAAQAQGLVGQEATQAFITLDVQDNPAAYLQAQAYADQNGRLLARVTNTSPVTLRNIRVDFAALIGGGVRRQSSGLQSLPAGAATDIDSGLSFPRGTVLSANMMNAEVVSAQP